MPASEERGAGPRGSGPPPTEPCWDAQLSAPWGRARLRPLLPVPGPGSPAAAPPTCPRRGGGSAPATRGRGGHLPRGWLLSSPPLSPSRKSRWSVITPQPQIRHREVVGLPLKVTAVRAGTATSGTNSFSSRSPGRLLRGPSPWPRPGRGPAQPVWWAGHAPAPSRHEEGRAGGVSLL